MSENPISPINVSYERKTEVRIEQPADVTRAKASAWLDIISPITEWAGLKGDALRHKRDILRLEQESALFEVAAHLKKRLEGKTIYQIPTKQLVPALEKASLEKPGSEFSQRWANLLASAAENPSDEVSICISILSEIGPTEADALDRSRLQLSGSGLWTPERRNARHDAWNSFLKAEYENLQEVFGDFSESKFQEPQLQERLIEFASRSPYTIRGFSFSAKNGDQIDRGLIVSDAGRIASDILEYRNLIRKGEYWELLDIKSIRPFRGTLTIHYLYLTDLAVMFLSRVASD